MVENEWSAIQAEAEYRREQIVRDFRDVHARRVESRRRRSGRLSRRPL